MKDLRNDLNERRAEPKQTKMGGRSKVQYVRETRAEARQRELDALVPDRKCPVCLEVKPGSRVWVVLTPYHRSILEILSRDATIEPEAKAALKVGCICRACAQGQFDGKLWSVKAILRR